MTELIYHDPTDHTGISPFDKAVQDISQGDSVSIACPYITPSYITDITSNVEYWRLVTDIGEWLDIHNEESRKAVQGLISEYHDQVKQVPDLHAKVVIGDGKALVGSANLTEKGLTRRTEMAVLLDDEEMVDELREWFQTLWSLYDSPEVRQVEKYMQSADATPAPAIKQSEIAFPAEHSPGLATLTESVNNDMAVDSGSEVESENTGDPVKSDDEIPSPVSPEMPPIPVVSEFKTKTDKEYYNQLISENDNQVNAMRRIIREEEDITKTDLKTKLREERDVSISGSFDADLRVLWRSTKEITPKNPRGNEAVLRWVGK